MVESTNWNDGTVQWKRNARVSLPQKYRSWLVGLVPDEDPMTVAQALVTNDLGLSHVRVVRATRTRQKVPTRPGILKIELKNTEEKINVLRSKINLKARRSGVFLHSAESHTDRLMVTSLRYLAAAGSSRRTMDRGGVTIMEQHDAGHLYEAHE